MKNSKKFLIFLVIVLLLTYITCTHQDRMWREKSRSIEKVNQELSNLSTETPAWTSSTHTATRGDWTFRINYATNNDDNYAAIYSKREMKENAEAGSKGKVLAKIQLSKNAETAEQTLHFNEGMNEIYVQIYHCEGELRINSVEVEDSTKYTDRYWALAITLLISLILHYLLTRKHNHEGEHRNRITVALLSFTIMYSSIPLMNTFLAKTHDLYFHLSRIEGIAIAMQNGDFPMWINMSGEFYLGYANPALYPQLFLYIPAMFVYFGMSLMNAYKLFIVIINAATAIISYLCFKKIFNSRFIGLLTAVAYTLCLYRLIDIYTRGAMGEMLASVFLPVCFYGMYEVCTNDEKKWPFLVLGITGVLSSHVLSTTFVGLYMAVYFIILIPKMWHNRFWKRIVSLVKTIAITFLVNLYFIVPFLHYYLREPLRIFTRGNGKEAASNAAYLSQMFSTWVSADNNRGSIETGSTQGEMAITIGALIPICCIIFAFISFCIRKYITEKISIDGDKERINCCFNLGNYALFGTVLAIYLSSDLFPWEKIDNIPILSILSGVQFPWRFLMMAQLFGIIVLGCLIQLTVWYRPKWKLAALLSVLCFSVISASPYLDNTSEESPISDRALVGIATTDDLYRYTVPDEGKVLEHYEYLGISSSVAETEITDFSRKGTTLQFHYKLAEGQNGATLSLPLYAYPGFTLTVNGIKQDYSVDDYGLMEIYTNIPEADVIVKYTGSPSWRLAYYVSEVTAAIIVLYFAFKKICIFKSKKMDHLVAKA